MVPKGLSSLRNYQIPAQNRTIPFKCNHFLHVVNDRCDTANYRNRVFSIKLTILTMSSRGKCVYNCDWERNPAYKEWVRQFKGDKLKALCTACDQIIDVFNMGEAGAAKKTVLSCHLIYYCLCYSYAVLKSVLMVNSIALYMSILVNIKRTPRKMVQVPGKVLEFCIHFFCVSFLEIWS